MSNVFYFFELKFFVILILKNNDFKILLKSDYQYYTQSILFKLFSAKRES